MASNILFGRYASLKIGVPGEAGVIIKSLYRNEAGFLEQGLRFSFKIEKTADAAPNKAHIDIYNLSHNTINKLKKKGAVISLSAGYGGIFDNYDPVEVEIFRGDVVKCQTVKQTGGDYITTIENGDSILAFQNSQFSGSFAPGATVKGILDSIVSSFSGVGKGEISGVDGQYLNGVTLSGSSRDSMDMITAKTNTEWSIQDGLVQVLPVNAATQESVIVLQSLQKDENQRSALDIDGNPINTGLIGSPNRSGFSNSKEKKYAGVEFKSLLNGGLKPGRRVQIISSVDDINGIYIVRKVTHSGDTRQGPWYSECEGAAP